MLSHLSVICPAFNVVSVFLKIIKLHIADTLIPKITHQQLPATVSIFHFCQGVNEAWKQVNQSQTFLDVGSESELRFSILNFSYGIITYHFKVCKKRKALAARFALEFTKM